jgi:DNA-binding NarL/FixJ family response regulator
LEGNFGPVEAVVFVALMTEADAALALIEEAPPAIVFVGIGRRGTGSMDFIWSLRTNQSSQHIQLLLLTGVWACG